MTPWTERRALSRALLALALALAPLAPLHAQEGGAADEALRLYNIGQLQFEGREFAEAAQTFRRAFDLDPNAVLAYNVARAYENDGDLDEARAFYTRALALSPSPEVEKRSQDALIRIERAEARLREQIVSQETLLQIDASPPARILLDGQDRGLTPQSIPVQPGEHSLTLSADDHRAQALTVAVNPGERRAVSILLNPVESYDTLAWIGWGTAATGLLSLGGGIWLAGEAQDTYDDAQSLQAQRDPARFRDLRTQGEQERDLAQLFTWGGGALIGVGLGLVLTSWLLVDDAPEQPAAGLLLWLSPQQAGAAWRW
jgi:tetratricopeptide (TPR) repeat protein